MPEPEGRVDLICEANGIKASLLYGPRPWMPLDVIEQEYTNATQGTSVEGVYKIVEVAKFINPKWPGSFNEEPIILNKL